MSVIVNDCQSPVFPRQIIIFPKENMGPGYQSYQAAASGRSSRRGRFLLLVLAVSGRGEAGRCAGILDRWTLQDLPSTKWGWGPHNSNFTMVYGTQITIVF